MHNLRHSTSESNQPFTTGSLSVGLPDSPAAEQQAQADDSLAKAIALAV